MNKCQYCGAKTINIAMHAMPGREVVVKKCYECGKLFFVNVNPESE